MTLIDYVVFIALLGLCKFGQINNLTNSVFRLNMEQYFSWCCLYFTSHSDNFRIKKLIPCCLRYWFSIAVFCLRNFSLFNFLRTPSMLFQLQTPFLFVSEWKACRNSRSGKPVEIPGPWEIYKTFLLNLYACGIYSSMEMSVCKSHFEVTDRLKALTLIQYSI